MKFYAVKVGHNPGVYSNWPEAQKQVNGFPSAKHKSFSTEAEAVAYLNEPLVISESTKPTTTTTAAASSTKTINPKYNCDQTLLTNLQRYVRPLTDRNVFIKDEEFQSFIVAYTDGACVNNGKNHAKAGIGIYWGENHSWNVSDRWTHKKTNNSAEIGAAIVAIIQAHSHGYKQLKIRTDSEFLINCCTKWIPKWVKNSWCLKSTGGEVKNKSELQVLWAMWQNNGLQIKLEHVRGHSGNKGNNAADRLARKGIL